MHRLPILIAALLACTLAAPMGSAMYIATPLAMFASSDHAEVGDRVDFRIEPGENATAASAWAGRSARVVLSYEGDAGGEAAYERRVLDEPVALDANARGSFTWTVPSDLDDKNVGVLLESDDGELLAQADVAVGDAPPIMKALMTETGEAPEETTPTPAEAAQDDGPSTERDVPLAPALALAAVALAAIVIRARAR